ncbi:MAG: hypothetical protein ACPIOQ_55830, partial [Promethearchaeia archaeon]
SALAPLAVGDARALMKCGPPLLFCCPPHFGGKNKIEARERDDRRAETDRGEGPQRRGAFCGQGGSRKGAGRARAGPGLGLAGRLAP